MVTQVANYRDEHFAGVDRLWSRVFPDDPARNHAAHAIPAKLALGDGLFFVALDEQGAVIGTTMAGWDGHRGWLYAVAVDERHRRGGVGRAMVKHALAALKARGCEKVNLQIREGNEAVAAFYESLGFAVEPRTSMGRVI